MTQAINCIYVTRLSMHMTCGCWCFSRSLKDLPNKEERHGSGYRVPQTEVVGGRRGRKGRKVATELWYTNYSEIYSNIY